MKNEHTEELKSIAKYAIIPVLGAFAVKNIYEKGRTLHVSTWGESTKSFILDIIHDGQEKTIRLSGVLVHGISSPDVLDIELDEREYSEEDIEELEKAAFRLATEKQT